MANAVQADSYRDPGPFSLADYCLTHNSVTLLPALFSILASE